MKVGLITLSLSLCMLDDLDIYELKEGRKIMLKHPRRISQALMYITYTKFSYAGVFIARTSKLLQHTVKSDEFAEE